MNKKRETNLKSIILIVILVIFLSSMLMSLLVVVTPILFIAKSSTSNNKSYDSSTYGQIVSINEENKNYDVLVKYEVSGTEYEGYLTYYDSNMYVGQKVKILYNSKNPEKFYSNPLKNISGFTASSLSFIIPIFLFIIVCIIIIVRIILKKSGKAKSRKILMKKGLKVQGIVQNICIVNENQERAILCNYNTLDGQVVNAMSEPTYEKLENFYKLGDYKVVDVYINSENNWDYYVDIDSIKR